MNRLRIAVVGGGHLGRIHARLLKQREDVELTAVVDPVAETRQLIAEQLAVPTAADIRELPAAIDAAIVAAPTCFHLPVALPLLQQGIHLLVEKPLAPSPAEAEQLVAVAQQQGCVLQVGHVERFNPVWEAVQPWLTRPRYLEASRCSGFSGRSVDIGVVLDLMIHDLDLVLALVPDEVVDVHAVGATVFGPHEDMAHARLQFAGGTVANLRASRVNPQPERTMQIYHEHAALELDFGGPAATVIEPTPQVSQGLDIESMSFDERLHIRDHLFEQYLVRREIPVEPGNAIQQEHDDLVTAIVDGGAVRVPGTAGRDAIVVARRILDAIASHRWTDTAPPPVHWSHRRAG